MKETIKKLPLIGRKSVEIYSAYLRWHDKKFLKKNVELKDSALGKRCFVIATGPSIKTQDLTRLAGEISISVSNFYVHPDFKTIKPLYHIFAPSHLPITPEQYGVMLKDSEKYFPENQNIFISTTDRHIVEKFGVLKKQNVYYYTPGHKDLKASRDIDFTNQLPAIQTSPHIAIYLALYVGAKEIFLLGTDHDWILHLGETRHFYDEKDSSLSQAGYNEWSETDLGTECAAYVSLWDKYRKIRSYAKHRGIPMYNATVGGLLDLFPRKKLEDITKETT